MIKWLLNDPEICALLIYFPAIPAMTEALEVDPVKLTPVIF